MKQKRLRRIIFIFPGPIYEPHTTLKSRLELLSSHFEGVAVTSSSDAANLQYGNFRVLLSTFHYRLRILNDFNLLFGCLRELVRAKRANITIDLIVTYDPLKTGLIGWFVAKLARAKLIVEVNGVYQSPYLYSRGQGANSELRRKALIFLERFVLRRAAGIKLLFDQQIDLFRGALTHQVVDSYFDYVNTERFYTDSLSEKCILFIGHPFYVKGVDILLDAFKRIQAEFPDWKLKVLGWFRGWELDAMREICAINSQIEYHPAVLYSEIPRHISKCAFLVLPSRTEAMGRVLIEAMACGKPRVGSRIDGIPTVIEHEHDGLLFTAENTDELGGSLARLMRDDQLRERLGRNALHRSSTDFSGQRYLEKTLAFYGRVLSS